MNVTINDKYEPQFDLVISDLTLSEMRCLRALFNFATQYNVAEQVRDNIVRHTVGVTPQAIKETASKLFDHTDEALKGFVLRAG